MFKILRLASIWQSLVSIAEWDESEEDSYSRYLSDFMGSSLVTGDSGNAEENYGFILSSEQFERDLKRHINDQNIFVTFTSTPVVGTNYDSYFGGDDSKYKTPAGQYMYPLREFVLSTSNFQKEEKYIIMTRSDPDHTLRFSEYDWVDYGKDIKLLESGIRRCRYGCPRGFPIWVRFKSVIALRNKELPSVEGEWIEVQFLRKEGEEVYFNTIGGASNNRRRRSDEFFKVSRYEVDCRALWDVIQDKVSQYDSSIHRLWSIAYQLRDIRFINFTKVFLDLGYKTIYDDGFGIIHVNESRQGIHFYPRTTEVLGIYHNPGYKDNPDYKEKIDLSEHLHDEYSLMEVVSSHLPPSWWHRAGVKFSPEMQDYFYSVIVGKKPSWWVDSWVSFPNYFKGDDSPVTTDIDEVAVLLEAHTQDMGLVSPGKARVKIQLINLVRYVLDSGAELIPELRKIYRRERVLQKPSLSAEEVMFKLRSVRNSVFDGVDQDNSSQVLMAISGIRGIESSELNDLFKLSKEVILEISKSRPDLITDHAASEIFPVINFLALKRVDLSTYLIANIDPTYIKDNIEVISDIYTRADPEIYGLFLWFCLREGLRVKDEVINFVLRLGDQITDIKFRRLVDGIFDFDPDLFDDLIEISPILVFEIYATSVYDISANYDRIINKLSSEQVVYLINKSERYSDILMRKYFDLIIGNPYLPILTKLKLYIKHDQSLVERESTEFKELLGSLEFSEIPEFLASESTSSYTVSFILDELFKVHGFSLANVIPDIHENYRIFSDMLITGELSGEFMIPDWLKNSDTVLGQIIKMKLSKEKFNNVFDTFLKDKGGIIDLSKYIKAHGDVKLNKENSIKLFYAIKNLDDFSDLGSTIYSLYNVMDIKYWSDIFLWVWGFDPDVLTDPSSFVENSIPSHAIQTLVGSSDPRLTPRHLAKHPVRFDAFIWYINTFLDGIISSTFVNSFNEYLSWGDKGAPIQSDM
jgi:hypothetical protein